MRVKLKYQPTLTTEKAVAIISRYFGYETGSYSKNWLTVKKNAMIAVTIRVFQYENSTEIKGAGKFPTIGMNLLMTFLCLFTGVGFILFIVYGILQLGFEKEVTNFIESNPEFNAIPS